MSYTFIQNRAHSPTNVHTRLYPDKVNLCYSPKVILLLDMVHSVLSIIHISTYEFKSLQWQQDNSHKGSITLTKATAGHFVWEPVDELLVIVQHSRSRWDRE